MTGSFGTLGVVTEINFRLHPLEEHARSWTAAMVADEAGPERFREPLRTLMDSQLVPSCVQMSASKRRCAVDVRVAGLPECLDEYGARVASIFSGFEMSDATETVWEARQRVFDTSGALILKVSVLPDEICPVSAEILQRGSGMAEIDIIAQITGLMMVSVAAFSEGVLDFVDWLRKRLDPSGGSVVVLRTPAALKGRIDVWGSERSTVPLMREIKRKFDPQRILNPGRFVGGI
jgi:glycolate oxidase FAD binding subunit